MGQARSRLANPRLRCQYRRPMKRRILVTSGLPYANGQLHIGHLVEAIMTDVFVRYQKSTGADCHYFCGDDTHGAPLMLRARAEGRPPEDLIADMHAAHLRDYAGFAIEHSFYGSTHSEANRQLCHEFWRALRGHSLVAERDVEQLYDVSAKMFLADRFVKGTCPKCGAKDQYGDSCEKCGATYSAIELIDPISTVSGSAPELRSAQHLFVTIEKEHAFLDHWTQSSAHLQPEIANYLKNFFLNAPLRDWDISRPEPYFGFEIPDSPGNFWYVWFDAPIGYIAATQEWCQTTEQELDSWWRSDDVEIVHVIGKDIVYFHTLFWPAMLKTAGFSLPKRVQVHGFLTVNGEKMSKSRGTQIQASTYLEHLDPEHLRYYYATKLNGHGDDLDLDLDDFVQKVNSDLVGKVVNLASRSARFIKQVGLAPEYPDDGGLFATAAAAASEIAAAYEQFDFARAMRQIMALADRANEYIDQKQPWTLRKQAGKEAEVQAICTVCLNLYRQLVIYLQPVLPRLAEGSARLLEASTNSWADAQTPTLGHAIGAFEHLTARVDPAAVAKVLELSSETVVPAPKANDGNDGNDDDATLAAEPLAPECTFDDFMKVDLRVARVIGAEAVPKANKLLKLTLSLGGSTTRTVFAGIKEAYAPESLIGRLVVMVANLAPRQMKFGLSEGMVVAAGPGKNEVFLLSPDSGAKPGQRIH